MITEIIEAVYFCVGAVDGQTVRIPFADREVFVTFRVRRQFSPKFHFFFVFFGAYNYCPRGNAWH